MKRPIAMICSAAVTIVYLPTIAQRRSTRPPATAVGGAALWAVSVCTILFARFSCWSLLKMPPRWAFNLYIFFERKPLIDFQGDFRPWVAVCAHVPRLQYCYASLSCLLPRSRTVYGVCLMFHSNVSVTLNGVGSMDRRHIRKRASTHWRTTRTAERKERVHQLSTMGIGELYTNCSSCVYISFVFWQFVLL
jgi:hypothetical protein